MDEPKSIISKNHDAGAGILRIHLFGGLRVYFGDEQLALMPTRKACSLFAYLVTHRQQAHARERLAGLFWGDKPEARAKHSLSTALWRIRHAIFPDYIRSDAHGIAFNTELPYWLDTEAFDEALSLAADHPRE